MSDSGGADGDRSPPDKKKTTRPTIQIYRPGMMKRGTDITLLPRSDEERLAGRPPLPEQRHSTMQGMGRRRSSQDSQASSHISSVGGSGSTTAEGRAPAQTTLENSHRYHNKRQQPRPPSNARNTWKSSREGSTDDIRSTISYNSTQSLYNTRRQGGYLDNTAGSRIRDDERPPRLLVQSRQKQPLERRMERSSMRGEESRRKGERRRKDSLTSTQSEMLQGSSHNQECRWASSESASVSGVAAALDSTLSIPDFCSSFESMATMDWGAEMEREYNEKMLRERECKEETEKEDDSRERERQEGRHSNDRAILRVKLQQNGQRKTRLRREEEEERGERRQREEDKDEKKLSRLEGRVTHCIRGIYQPQSSRAINVSSNRFSKDGNAFRESSQEKESTTSPSTPSTIVQLEKDLTALLTGLGKRKDVAKAEEVVRISMLTAQEYKEDLLKDIKETFSTNKEQKLWRHSFHQPIQTLRSASNSTGEAAVSIRKLLQRFIDQAISFYSDLLTSYDSSLSLELSRRFAFRSALPPSDLPAAIPLDTILIGGSSITQIALKSASRHLLCLADLYRYRSTVAGDEDYSEAEKLYLQASWLWPASGHCYNQLSVLSYYAMLYRSPRRSRLTPLALLSNSRQERVLKEFFYAVRALAAEYPFEAMRERLALRMHAARKKGDKYEILLDKQFGPVHQEATEQEGERRNEQWIDLQGTQREEPCELPQLQQLMQMESSQLHRRTMSYVVFAASLLIGKIGMEQWRSVSSRLFSHLSASLTQLDSPLSAIQLLYISSLVIYSTHVARANATDDTYSSHEKTCVDAMLSLMAVIMERVSEMAGELASLLSPSSPPPSPALTRLLPSLFLFSEWMRSPMGFSLYSNQMNLHPLPPLRLWTPFAKVVNVLVDMDEKGLLCKVEENPSNDGIGVMLPEGIVLASLLSVFPSTPKIFYLSSPLSPSSSAVNIRLRSLLNLAQFLHGTQSVSLSFNKESGRFEASDQERVEHLPLSTLLPSSSRPLLIVHPTYLVIDTNTFIDDLHLVTRLIATSRFQILIPTIVVDELVGLSQGRSGWSGERDESHASFVASAASSAVSWLRECSKERPPNLSSLSSKGHKLIFSLMQEQNDSTQTVNDDRILEACTLFAENVPWLGERSEGGESLSPSPIHRSLVLITADRGLSIKATAHSLPSRTLHAFLTWARVI